MRSLASWFKALSEDVRLEIVALIDRHGPLCGCEVEHVLGISQSKASRHLRYLLKAGVLEDRRDGLWVYYGLAEPSSDGQRRLLRVLREVLGELPLPDVEEDLRARRAERCPPVMDEGTGQPEPAGVVS